MGGPRRRIFAGDSEGSVRGGRRELRVVRRNDDEIVLYSVGADGVDDGGAELDKRGRPNRGRFASVDFVYRFRRAGTGAGATTTPSR